MLVGTINPPSRYASLSSTSAEFISPRLREIDREHTIAVRRRLRIPWKAAGRHAVLILLCCWVIFPLAIVVINSVESKVDSVHNNIWPSAFVHPLWARYEWVWTNFTLDNLFFRLYWNSIFVTGLTVAVGTLSAVLAGYALSHLATPGKSVILGILVVSLFLPLQVTTMLGVFKLHWDLGLIDETWALMLPYVAAGIAISTFVMRAVFQMVSKEIPDSARVDGATSLRILGGIMLPMVRNGIVVVVIINFMYAWSEYMLASVLMNHQESRTLAVTLGGIGPGASAQFIVALIPSVLVLGIGQRWYSKALQEGAFKG
jgi:ABC-type glycerol-3-phosphate transport system permease component